MNFFRSLWDKFVEKYIEFVGLNPSDVYNANEDEFELSFQPINCRCVLPVMEDNMLTLKYDNGKLYFGADTFFCEDSVDMELLVNKVNQSLMENKIERDRACNKLELIKGLVD